MANAFREWRRRRARRREQKRKRDWADCGGDCLDCGDCSPFMLSPLLLLLRVVPGAFRADAVNPWVARPGGVLARGAARMIRSYQLNVSVPRARSMCSMTPTCSRYGLQAVSRHGLWRGGLLVVRRLRRCGGDTARFDPVPPAR